MSVKEALMSRIKELPEDIARELFEKFDEVLEDLYDARLAKEARKEGFVNFEEATRRLVESGKLPAEYLEKVPKSDRKT